MTQALLQRHIQKNPEACASFVDNELVVMGHKDHIYYKINHSGIHIWQLLEANTVSVQQLIDAIAAHYTVTPNQVEQDVLSFVSLMLEKELFEFV